MQRARRGTTLAELLVTLTVGGIVLSLIAAVALRGQRFFAGMTDVLAVSRQLQETATILPVDLRGIASRAGDVRAGEARDTSLEIRATIASAIICDTALGRVILAPAAPATSAFASLLSSPQPGDTAWILAPPESIAGWRAHPILDVGAQSPGPCSSRGPILRAADLAVGRVALRLDSLANLAALLGEPLRITRPVRYSIYRSSDGGWYLGQKEWNPAAQRFNTIQPVSGPFLSAASGGLRLQYYDSTATELAPGSSATESIALLHIGLRAQTARSVRAPGWALDGSGRATDSVGLSVLVRNRR